jgi:hypothetical protein
VTRQRSGTGRPSVEGDGRVRRETLPEPAQQIRWERKHASTATLQHASLGLDLAPLIHEPRSDRMFVASDHGRDIMHAPIVELAESGQGR